MYKVFYIKQQNNEGGKFKSSDSDNQSPWKVPGMQVIWVFSGLADHYDYYSRTNTSISPLLYCNRLSSSSPGTVFMIQTQGGVFGVLLLMCVEWFLYGKISCSKSMC